MSAVNNEDTDVAREVDDDCPACGIIRDDGDAALKSYVEVRRVIWG